MKNDDQGAAILTNSIYTPTKAKMFKRLLAALLDIILFFVAVSGFALVTSYAIGYQTNIDKLEEKYIEHGVYVPNEAGDYEYCVITEGDSACNTAWTNFNKDEVAIKYYDDAAIQTIYILAIAVFATELIFDFVIPTFMKNGRTIGMFCLGIALIDVKGIRITNRQLFIRFLFGKFLLVSMFPIIFFFMHFFNAWPTVGLLLSAGIILTNLIMKFLTENKVGIADAIGKTYMIDNASQVYVNTIEELNALKSEELRIQSERKPIY